jgi:hypothetical protein
MRLYFYFCFFYDYEWKTGGRVLSEEVSIKGCVPSELASEDALIQIGDIVALWI